MDFGMQLVQVGGSLALLLGLMVLGLYAVKRFGVWVQKPDANRWIQVMGRHHLDPKHYLLVVKSRDQLFLLGVSPQGMHLLSPLDKAGAVPSDAVE